MTDFPKVDWWAARTWVSGRWKCVRVPDGSGKESMRGAACVEGPMGRWKRDPEGAGKVDSARSVLMGGETKTGRLARARRGERCESSSSLAWARARSSGEDERSIEVGES